MRGTSLILAGAILVIGTSSLWAQSSTTIQLPNGGGTTGPVTYCVVGTVVPGTCSVPITGTFSATVAVSPLTSTNLSGTIAVTNTFQSIQVSTAGRQGCLIQNQSTTDQMWVYFGAIGGATKAKSFILDTAHGLAISCAVGGLGVLTDQVSITGTAPDGFTANFQ